MSIDRPAARNAVDGATAAALAEQIAAFPQTCLRKDRLSARDQHELSEVDAMAMEFRYGKESLAADASADAGWAALPASAHERL